MTAVREILTVETTIGEITGDPVLSVKPATPLLQVADVLASANVGALVVRANQVFGGRCHTFDRIAACQSQTSLR